MKPSAEDLAWAQQLQKPATNTNLLAWARENKLTLTGGYRTPQRNREVGGVPNSYHTKGDAHNPGAIDIDHNGVDLNWLRSHAPAGYEVIDERGKKGAPHYHIEPSGKSGVRNARASNAARTKELTLPVPKVGRVKYDAPIPETIEPHHPTAEDLEWSKSIQPAQAKPAGFMETAGQYIQGAANHIGQGIQTTFNNRMDLIQNPDLGRSMLMMPQVQLGAGAFSETANLINGALQLPADIGNATGIGLKPGQSYAPLIPNIPTGELEKVTELDPVVSTVGRAAPYAFGEAGLVEALGATAKGAKLLKTIDSSAKLRALSSAGVNAAEGFIAAPGEGGLNQRFINAGVGGVLGAGAQVGLDALTGKLKPLPEVAPQPTKTYNTQADMIRDLAKSENAAKVREIGEQVQSPGALNPAEMTGNPTELTQSFKARGGEVPGTAPKGNLDAQVVDAQGKPIQSPDGGAMKTPYEIALERTKTAEVPSPGPALLDAQGRPANTRELEAPPPEPTRQLDGQAVEAPQILDAQGQPLRKPGVVRELEIPGRPKPGDPSNLEIQRRPIGDDVDMVPGTSKMKELVQDNQMPVPKAGEIRKAVDNLPATDEPINPAKPRTLETSEAAQSQGIELINVAEAREFIQKHQPTQVSHFDNILEAAKNNQTISVGHRPLSGGGRVENAREIHPVDFGKKTIQGRTEVANLLKEFVPSGKPDEAAFAAVRDNLVQRLAANKIQVGAKDQNITGATPLAVKRKLNALANRLPEHERTHVYVMDHNLDTTERGQTYGFRRVDRLTNSSLTGKAQAVPEVSQYQNKIKPAFDAMRQMADMPDTPPEVAKAIKNLTNKGSIGRKESARMKEWLRNNYSSFCKLFGLE